jgi:hypothetical protein
MGNQFVAAGESQTITLEINAKDLALFQQKTPGLRG